MSATDTLAPCPCGFCGAILHRTEWHKTLWTGHESWCYLAADLLFDSTVERFNRRAPAQPSQEAMEISTLAKLVTQERARYTTWSNGSEPLLNVYRDVDYINEESPVVFRGSVSDAIQYIDEQVVRVILTATHAKGEAEGYARGIAAAADKIEPAGKAPCGCIKFYKGYWMQECDCQNNGDLASAESWCAYKNDAGAIRALSPSTASAKADSDEVK